MASKSESRSNSTQHQEEEGQTEQTKYERSQQFMGQPNPQHPQQQHQPPYMYQGGGGPESGPYPPGPPHGYRMMAGPYGPPMPYPPPPPHGYYPPPPYGPPPPMYIGPHGGGGGPYDPSMNSPQGGGHGGPGGRPVIRDLGYTGPPPGQHFPPHMQPHYQPDPNMLHHGGPQYQGHSPAFGNSNDEPSGGGQGSRKNSFVNGMSQAPGQPPLISAGALQQQQQQTDPQYGEALYKTELCKSFSETGYCRYGLKCRFAHGLVDLRLVQRHKKYKTEKCKNFTRDGVCPYGPRCRFIHNAVTQDQDELPGLGAVQSVSQVRGLVVATGMMPPVPIPTEGHQSSSGETSPYPQQVADGGSQPNSSKMLPPGGFKPRANSLTIPPSTIRGSSPTATSANSGGGTPLTPQQQNNRSLLANRAAAAASGAGNRESPLHVPVPISTYPHPQANQTSQSHSGHPSSFLAPPPPAGPFLRSRTTGDMDEFLHQQQQPQQSQPQSQPSQPQAQHHAFATGSPYAALHMAPQNQLSPPPTLISPSPDTADLFHRHIDYLDDDGRTTSDAANGGNNVEDALRSSSQPIPRSSPQSSLSHPDDPVATLFPNSVSRSPVIGPSPVTNTNASGGNSSHSPFFPSPNGPSLILPGLNLGPSTNSGNSPATQGGASPSVQENRPRSMSSSAMLNTHEDPLVDSHGSGRSARASISHSPPIGPSRKLSNAASSPNSAVGHPNSASSVMNVLQLPSAVLVGSNSAVERRSPLRSPLDEPASSSSTQGARRPSNVAINSSTEEGDGESSLFSSPIMLSASPSLAAAAVSTVAKQLDVLELGPNAFSSDAKKKAASNSNE